MLTMSKSNIENTHLPMAISTITSPNSTGEALSSSSCSSSPTMSESSQYSGDLSHHDTRMKPRPLPMLQRYQPYPTDDSSTSPPLSLQERRQRNKAASAKYRAKKNQQHGEMRSLIASLTRENELLQRQIEHYGQENSQLKATCDRLRGKMMAEKMIKRMMLDDKCDVRRLEERFQLEDAGEDDDLQLSL
ncbi:hypothetical protein BJV82DRAFT_602341 [Fennellomyces sp. T-0311]|nr:hypothetical protein BJV82DRAFT_602341 [Fennellomyces sp. T-0311]